VPIVAFRTTVYLKLALIRAQESAWTADTPGASLQSPTRQGMSSASANSLAESPFPDRSRGASLYQFWTGTCGGLPWIGWSTSMSVRSNPMILPPLSSLRRLSSGPAQFRSSQGVIFSSTTAWLGASPTWKPPASPYGGRVTQLAAAPLCSSRMPSGEDSQI